MGRRDELNRMAKEAGLGFSKGNGWGTHAGTHRFAELVAAAERDVCAKMCEQMKTVDGTDEVERGWNAALSRAAKHIRRRNSPEKSPI